MARRRVLPAPAPVELPWDLRRENTWVERWVPWDEPAPSHWSGEPEPCLSWRRLTAWRRWQAAVERWGAEQGFDARRLRELRLWPIAPPSFGDLSRLRGPDFWP